MSDLSESGSSGLSDWALVNSQGELEGSDADSNTSSIEVVGREAELEDEIDHVNSRESSPEYIELEDLEKNKDAAAAVDALPSKVEPGHQGLSQFRGLTDEDNDGEGSSGECQPTQWEPLGACSPGLLPRLDDSSPTEKEATGKEEDDTQSNSVSQLSQESDPPATLDSIVSLSEASSFSSTSRSSRADSDSESDFVRLEKESSCVSTESEGEEPHSFSNIGAMTTSGSSVGSGFNFLSGSSRGASAPRMAASHPQFLQQQATKQQLPSLCQEQIPPQEELVPSPSPPPVLDARPPFEPAQEDSEEIEGERIVPQGEEVEDAEEEEIVYEDVEENEADEEEHAEEGQDQEDEAGVGLPVPQNQQQPAGMLVEAAAPQDDDDDDDDADTESSTEDGDQDDRIESEQSDDANSAPPDEFDQIDLSVVNDIGDLPVERGLVERHYIHNNNLQLNNQLNTVVVAVLVLAVGMGLGHWIGSTREHFSQLEIQLSQMKRLHQVQDEYMQCLARNDELLIDADAVLQAERNRHQEAMADLRDNNRELQEQLQDAQDRLEQLLTATARAKSSQRRQSPLSFAADFQDMVTMSKLLLADEEQFQANLTTWDTESRQHLMQLRKVFRKAMFEKEANQYAQFKIKLQQAATKERQQTLMLQELRQHVNNLEMENADLQISVGKMRYGHEGPSEEPLPPPPKPVPPPPFAAMDIDQRAKADPEQKDTGSDTNNIGPEELANVRQDESFHANNKESQAGASSKTLGAGDEQEDVTDISDSVAEDDLADVTDISENEVEDPIEGVPDVRRADLDHQGRADPAPAKSECSPESPRPVPVDITLLQRNLTEERKRAEMWRHLYLSKQDNLKQEINTTTCLHYLAQHMNMSAFMHYMTRWNLTGHGTEDFTDLTYLVSSIAQLQQNLMQALPSLWEELSTKLQDLHDFTNYSTEEANQEEETDKENVNRTPDGLSGKDSSPKSKWSDGMKKLLNNTRKTLSNVSRHLQQTWNHLWHDHDSVFGRMATHLKDSMSKFSHKMRKKAYCWFKKRHSGGKGSKNSAADEMDCRKDKFRRKKASRDMEEEYEPTKTEVKGEFESKQHVKHGHHEHSHGTKDRDRKHHHDDLHDKDDKKGRHSSKYHQENSHGKDDKKKRYHKENNKKSHGRDEDMKRDQTAQEESRRKETFVHPQVNDHSFPSDKKSGKLRYKVQKKFHKLFKRVGSMNRKSYDDMDLEDLSKVRKDIVKVFELYHDSNEMGLPASGHQWLQCQFSFWLRAEQQHVRYDPDEVCLSHLEPWQFEFVRDLRARVERGECHRVRQFSCIGGGSPDDEKENYKYVCTEDADYADYKHESHDDNVDRKYGQSNDYSKGKRDPKHEGRNFADKDSEKMDATEESTNQKLSQQVNQSTDDPQAWYFQWVEGRNNLRSVEHKADWLFDRAAVRGETREQERSADWVFERAAGRGTRHDDDDNDDNDDDDDKPETHDKDRRSSQEKHHRRKKMRHDHRGKDHYVNRHSNKRKGKEKGKHFKQQKKDYRQKYGRTSFCHSC